MKSSIRTMPVCHVADCEEAGRRFPGTAGTPFPFRTGSRPGEHPPRAREPVCATAGLYGRDLPSPRPVRGPFLRVPGVSPVHVSS